VNSALDVLEVGDDRECHDDQQGPTTPFAKVDDRPRADLIRVSPCAEKRADILSQPNEEPDQHERQQQGDATVAVQWPEDDRRARV
jgi:hypothetical protein